MTKGFKRDGKFIPITDYNKKGTRKSRDKSEKTLGVLITQSRKKRLITEDDVDRLNDLELNALMNEVESRWDKKVLFADEGDHTVIIYKNRKNPSYTFEIHPLDDNEEEDENGNELEEPIYHDAWYWFPAKDGKGIPNSPSTLSETGGYTKEDAMKEFKKEFIIYDQEFNS